ncbi:hypothetical protein [Hydrogenophaga aquatica]
MSPSDPQAPAGHRPPDSSAPDQWRMADHWPELVVAVTDQSIESVSLLLRGLDLLVKRGRLTPAEYKVLAMPAERLKHCGINAQQIVRFQSGRVRQSHEKIDLAYLIESVLQERRNELAIQGIAVRRKFKPVDVLIDPTLGFSLTSAMLEWSTHFGHRIDLRLDAEGDPARARLWMKTYTEHEPVQSAVFEDSIHWLLLRQIATTDGGIDVERNVTGDGVELTACFRRTLGAGAAAPAAGLPDAGLHPESIFRTITGAYVVVCSADAETRLEAVDIVRKLGVAVDGVASGTQALDAMRGREVHLLVQDLAHPPADVAALQNGLKDSHPLMPVVEIGAAGAPARSGERPLIPRDALRQSLGSAVMFTLSKMM